MVKNNMTKMKSAIKLIFPICLVLFLSCTKKVPQIILPENTGQLEKLAASEIRKYIYLCSGELAVISSKPDSGIEQIILQYDPVLGDQEFSLQTENSGRNKKLTISGGSEIAVLYGAYEFAEQLGVRFYLHGDVVPDEKIKFEMPDIDIREKPVFKLRGIQPFHDFPEGPDWWNENDYKAIIGQLPKLKMNFIGFHTYPERFVKSAGQNTPEPLVWIGKQEDVNNDGTVKAAYSALHFCMQDSFWGYKPARTSDFLLGASQLFETDYFGADYMKEVSPLSDTEEEHIKLFNNVGQFFGKAFSFAHKLNVKTCVGTETPLTIPRKMKDHLGLANPEEKDILSVYKGIFTRIQRSYPLDYYWLWTPERWTWSGADEKDVIRTEKDLQLAYKALQELGNPFSLATCGWVLGPPNDRTEFDRILPKDVPFSCISREVGYIPVEKGFKNIQSRQKWAIPWLEDDANMISAQLWAGRLRKDAFDAYRYGCDGLFGIHWRTRILGPNVSCLAKAAWECDNWKVSLPDSVRDLPVKDFYNDWVKTEFGSLDTNLVNLFVAVDSKGLLLVPKEGHRRDSPLYASYWNRGPGALTVNKIDEERIARYDFIPEMEVCRAKISGAGNLERFDYWLNSFKFNKASLETALVQKNFDALVDRIEAETSVSKQKELAEKALQLRIELAGNWEKMTLVLLSKISTNGELGTLANLEMHNMRKLGYLTGHDQFLISMLGRELPAEAFPSMNYPGESRIIVTTDQGILEKGEDFRLRVRVLSQTGEISGMINWKPLGAGKYQKNALKRMDRNVFEATIPGSVISEDFEYYISVNTGEGQIVYPATAKNINKTVVILK
jgi:hypothetical protein